MSKPIPNVGHNLKIRSALFKLRLYPRMHKELWRNHGNHDNDDDDNDDNDEDGNDDNDDITKINLKSLGEDAKS